MSPSALQVRLHFSIEDTPVVGTLSQIHRTSVFQYDRGFLARGLPFSPFHLPPLVTVQAYDGKGGMETFGVFEDALPDGWGRRIIDTHFRNLYNRLPTLLERFPLVGEGGMGALTFHPVEPLSSATAPVALSELAENAWAFDDSQVADVLPELRRIAGSSGGARPKAYIGFNPQTGAVCAHAEILPEDHEHWIVKFNTRADGIYAGALEYVYSTLARQAGANVSPCRLIETKAGRFFATQRFDRRPGGRRLHLHSAAGLLHANFRIPGDEYEILFRLTDALIRDYAAKKELFRRVCLNVLLHNRDDHLKNFAYLMNADGEWSLAPFYDFTPANGPNGWHTLSIAGEGEHPRENDLLRLADSVSLETSDAKAIIEKTQTVCATFSSLAKDLGIPASVCKNEA